MVTYRQKSMIRKAHHANANMKGLPERPKWTDAGMFWLTVALIILAIVSAGVAFWQGRIASNQLAFARKSADDAARDTQSALAISNRVAGAAEDQAAASLIAAQSSKSSVTLSRLQLQLARTATVAFFVDGPPTVEAGQKLVARFTVKPSGPLPILNVRMATQLALSPPDPAFALHSRPKTMPWGFDRMNPGTASGSSISSDIALTDDIMKALADNRIRIYAHGEVRYADGNGPHVTHTCAEFFGEGGRESNACRTLPDY